MKKYLSGIDSLISKGGPDLLEYQRFSDWLDFIHTEIKEGQLDLDGLNEIRSAFGRAISSETMQGFAFTKPHGYPGDYEIIDKIYQEHISPDPSLEKWDRFFHAQCAPRAVRNRKAYFKKLLSSLEKTSSGNEILKVLNVASGPCRDLAEYLQSGNGALRFHCLDCDPDAIEYAKALCSDFTDHLDFIKGNVFKFSTEEKYRLIWSAGLFDYFDDKAFVFLLKRLLDFLDDSGELVIGNFSDDNDTRGYMEIIGDWHLHYRSEDHLYQLAHKCGIRKNQIVIGKEPECVNLFLHIRKQDNSIK